MSMLYLLRKTHVPLIRWLAGVFIFLTVIFDSYPNVNEDVLATGGTEIGRDRNL